MSDSPADSIAVPAAVSGSLKLSIVIPVYNEEKYIDEVLERVSAVRFQQGVLPELVVVDDCSSDGTYERLKAWESRGVRIARHEENGGKGAALHTGFRLATGDVLTVQDADFEYDPTELPLLLEPILKKKADVVFGARSAFMKSGAHRVMRYWHWRINHFLTVCSNMFSDLNLSDMECCYKMFRREILEQVDLKEKRFGFEPEVTLKISRLPVLVWEVPVSYCPRTYAEGKKITWKDGVSALRCILKYGLFHR